MNTANKPAPRLVLLPADANPDLKDAFANSVRSLGFIPNSIRHPDLTDFMMHPISG
jgi:hypothetical protein